jgi:FMN phosphatase YigB (HAD superfamily)
MKIFIDLDDVLCDFSMHALRYATGHNRLTEADYKPEWGFDLVYAFNEIMNCDDDSCTREDFWGNLLLGEEIWLTAPPTRMAGWLPDYAGKLFGYENACILTAPTEDPACASAKMKWIRKNMPTWLHRQFSICPCKHLLASADAILIDDSDKNIDAFREGGGRGILVPRPWNSMHEECHNRDRDVICAMLDAVYEYHHLRPEVE